MSNKTIEELMHTDNILAGTEAKLTEIGYERLGENIQEATQAINQLILQERIDELTKVIPLVKPEYHNVVVGKILELETKLKGGT